MTKGELRKQRQAEHAARHEGNPTRAERGAAYEKEVRRVRRAASRRPTPGSQEWAETRGDDLGESPDY